MPRKLNDSIIRSLALPDKGQRVVWDGGLPRFGLRLAAGGSRAWVVKYKVRGRSRWLTLGTYPLLKLTDARAKAKKALAKVVQGEDPAAERRAANAPAPGYAAILSPTLLLPRNLRSARPRRCWTSRPATLELAGAFRASPPGPRPRREGRQSTGQEGRRPGRA